MAINVPFITLQLKPRFDRGIYAGRVGRTLAGTLRTGFDRAQPAKTARINGRDQHFASAKTGKKRKIEFGIFTVKIKTR
jgi:hypothetical protein